MAELSPAARLTLTRRPPEGADWSDYEPPSQPTGPRTAEQDAALDRLLAADPWAEPPAGDCSCTPDEPCRAIDCEHCNRRHDCPGRDAA
ncbi:hypothetical protein [Actinotalea sp. Marseille-Q4924]|uniref:hypothetical protein n=1 Tax=Actinotalea sp. Marseille-Q4924 TaxID=2866571 RepID=UPI001CE3E3E7|nr:hypothetical protein [Actinotalea sp. Marseille-Q4924]